MTESTRTLRIAAAGLVLVLLGLLALTGAFYTRAFSTAATITVEAPRAGLIMAAGNKVKARGVEVGRVGSVERRGDGVVLELEIDRDVLPRIPADSVAELRASTVFGAKYVEIVPSGDSTSASALEDGDTIDARSVTTEVNTVFDQLDTVLSEVDTVALSTTLTTLAGSLDGRGDDVAALAASAESYLVALEPELPQLRRDLKEVAATAALFDRISPAFLTILENATVTGRTIATQQQKLDRLLVDLTLLGEQGTRFIEANGDAITRLVVGLQTPTATLRAYHQELPCLVKGAERTRQIMTGLFGGDDAGLRAELSVRSTSRTYAGEKDRLQVPKPAPTSCDGLPVVPGNRIPIPQVGSVR